MEGGGVEKRLWGVKEEASIVRSYTWEIEKGEG